MNGTGKARQGFKNFSIKIQDLAYSPALKNKIGTKRKRLLRHDQRNNINHNNANKQQKRMKLTDDNAVDDRTSSRAITTMVTFEEQDSTVCPIEQCWKLRTPFIEAFDLDQYEDSRDAATTLLKWLIYPVDCDKFLK